MKTHEQFEALLDAFLDGELSAEDMQAVEEHLNTCPDCRAYVDDCLAIRAAFPTLEDTAVPEGFADSVLAAVAAQSAPQKSRKVRRWVRVAAPLAACFALVLVLGLVRSAPFLSMGAQAPEAAAETFAVPRMAAEEASGAPEAAKPAEAAVEADTSPYFTELTLTADEAGDRFADLTPLEETESYTRYALPLSDFQQLLESLAEQGMEISEELPPQVTEESQALITVLH